MSSACNKEYPTTFLSLGELPLFGNCQPTTQRRSDVQETLSAPFSPGHPRLHPLLHVLRCSILHLFRRRDRRVIDKLRTLSLLYLMSLFFSEVPLLNNNTAPMPGESSGPHHQDSGEAKIRESTAGVSRKPSSDGKARGCSSKHLCGLTAWNT